MSFPLAEPAVTAEDPSPFPEVGAIKQLPIRLIPSFLSCNLLCSTAGEWDLGLQRRCLRRFRLFPAAVPSAVNSPGFYGNNRLSRQTELTKIYKFWSITAEEVAESEPDSASFVS